MDKFTSIYKLYNIPQGKEGGKRLKNKEKKKNTSYNNYCCSQSGKIFRRNHKKCN